MLQTLRIMIVDDQHLFAEGLKYIIEGESAMRLPVVGIACNGMEAVEMAKQSDPHVIMMDVRMPTMDGVEATRRIKSSNPTVKIMMLTTFDDDELVYDALSAGANGYVLKNVEPHDLVLAIEAVHTGALYVSPSVGFRLVDGGKFGGHDTHAASVLSTIVAKMPTLTVREAEVLEQVVRAKRNSEIAEALYISEKTVRNHISVIYEKLGVHNRLQLMSLVTGAGITLQPEQ